VTASASDDTRSLPRTSRFGVGARLLLAFFGIAAFVVLAAAAGIYAFREVGDRLTLIDARIPPALAAIELSRSAERIIAAAPSLLAASESSQRDVVKAELSAEVERLNGRLGELRGEGAQVLPLEEIETVVSTLTASLARLEALVALRLETSERLWALRRGAFQAHEETQRLLAPWLDILGSQVAMLVEADAGGRGDEPGRLAATLELQRLVRAAQAQVSTVAEMLSEASTTDQDSRLVVLSFQLGLALRQLDATAADLEPRLRPLFVEQLAKLNAFAEGADAIAGVRRQELALVAQGEELLAETAGLSTQLTAAVDRLGSAAKRDIDAAIGDALSVQQLSTRALVAVAALSLVTSVLIVWLYVGRSIVGRLTALSEGMLAIAGGRLETPIPVEGGDEIAAMGQAVEIFRRNTLERDGLELANRYKSQFLAAASHDLRQPLHALNLFVSQLREEADPQERERLVARIGTAVSAMNELFDALLDMAKLEAGLIQADVGAFPIAPLLARIETTFAEAARQKGLRLRVVASRAWVESDFVLLERILMNLASNAVRYTERGGVVVGCRCRDGHLRIDVCDSGAGIAEAQQKAIFGEFIQLPDGSAERRAGLGLGLAIVERLCRLLGHPVEVSSRLGSGSRFSVGVPMAAAPSEAGEGPSPPLAAVADPARGKLVVVVDDDRLALDGMAGILRSWGCEVVAAASAEEAAAQLAAHALPPDLIIADYRLAGGRTGIEAVERLRGQSRAAIPAFLISGDTAPERLREASAKGLHLLHKPVAPMRLRAMLNQLIRAREAAEAPAPAPSRRRAASPGRARRPR
jgi:signal transduction histidine kinase/FixJ family two-component response regulator